ncbi:uncharacterized protein TRIADDRAFT_58030 [Trichoplax adhaerens]|uniref:Chloride channel CLIC-like protein 1 n=1 Tax=Trichoplax adhaerens TaxID=10228 RepID=B3S2H8_TRIAD|nr:predicted protein [Trichoplax adhaerens]EDV23422.1 predicted protein [Trichoplax adhaerens]|eukprot:XP_002114332.1 predicted protein [Trichoplax adhaerens]
MMLFHRLFLFTIICGLPQQSIADDELKVPSLDNDFDTINQQLVESQVKNKPIWDNLDNEFDGIADYTAKGDKFAHVAVKNLELKGSPENDVKNNVKAINDQSTKISRNRQQDSTSNDLKNNNFKATNHQPIKLEGNRHADANHLDNKLNIIDDQSIKSDLNIDSPSRNRNPLNKQAALNQYLHSNYYQTFVKRLINVLKKINTTNEEVTLSVSIKTSEILSLEMLIDDISNLDRVDEIMNIIVDRTQPQSFSFVNVDSGFMLDSYVKSEVVLLIVLAAIFSTILLLCRGNYISLVVYFIVFGLILSWPWEWLRLYKEAIGKSLLNSRLETECRRYREAELKRSFAGTIGKYMYEFLFVSSDPCADNMKYVMKDALLDVTPNKALWSCIWGSTFEYFRILIELMGESFSPLLGKIPPLWQPVIAIVFIFVIIVVSLLPIACIVIAIRMLTNIKRNSHIELPDPIKKQLNSMEAELEKQNKKLQIQSQMLIKIDRKASDTILTVKNSPVQKNDYIDLSKSQTDWEAEQKCGTFEIIRTISSDE